MHLYTLGEVNALIPRLEFIMTRLQQRATEVRTAIDAVRREPGAVATEVEVNGLDFRPECNPPSRKCSAWCTRSSRSAGSSRLDFGLVDFTGEVDGERVLLCWQFGEKEVGFYHTEEAGFAGRQRLWTPPARVLQ